MQVTHRDEAVRLSLPASRDYVRVVRLTASAIATNLDFDVDELDDLRVGIGELANVALEASRPGATLEIVFTVAGSDLHIEGTVPAEAGRVVELDPLTRQILEGVVDDYSIEIVDGTVRFSCTRRPW
jgi:serine/threonine-protein kinase RsbW